MHMLDSTNKKQSVYVAYIFWLRILPDRDVLHESGINTKQPGVIQIQNACAAIHWTRDTESCKQFDILDKTR